MAPREHCANEVRTHDRDRWLATLWMPAAARPAVTAIFALDLVLARIVATTSEPVIGLIRLAWWRDALAALDREAPPAEPVLIALARNALPDVSGESIAAFTAHFEPLIEGDRGEEGGGGLQQAEATRGRELFALAARLLGATPATDLGSAWGLAEAKRAGRVGPSRALSPARVPGALRPLLALDRLGAHDLERGARLAPRGTLARQWLIARTCLLN